MTNLAKVTYAGRLSSAKLGRGAGGYEEFLERWDEEEELARLLGDPVEILDALIAAEASS